MMDNCPPGISYLINRAPSLLLPGVLTYAAAQYLGASTWLPLWVILVAVLLAKPLEFVVSTRLRRFQNARAADRLGAQVVPHVFESPSTIVDGLVEMFELGYPADLTTHWASKYGDIYETRLSTDSFIWTTEPEHVKVIMATEFENWPKEPLFLEQAASLLGDGIFNVNDEQWKFHRSITRPFFTRDRISDFEIFEEHTGKALSIAKSRLAEGYPIDVQDLIARFTLDSAALFLFAERLDSLSAGLAYPHTAVEENAGNRIYWDHPSNKFSDAFLAAITKGTRRTLLGSEWPLFEFWADAVKPHRQVIDRFSERVISKNLNTMATGSEDQGEADTLLEHLLHQTTDSKLIKDELFNMLLAGRDTTACTLSFGIYMLTQHPEVVQRLKEEVQDRVGASRGPGYDDIKDMRYLRAFLNEVMRLYPAVPFNWRHSKQSTVFSSKDKSKRYYIPAQTTVRYSVFMMHRRKDLWGPDADEFDPERFLDGRNRKYLLSNPYIFMPFNAGPRICLGQQFAYNEMSFFMIRLLQDFSEFTFAREAQEPQFVPPASWSLCEGTKSTEKVMPGANLTMYIKGGLWVRMK